MSTHSCAIWVWDNLNQIAMAFEIDLRKVNDQNINLHQILLRSKYNLFLN